MAEKIISKEPLFVFSEQALDRKDDIYAYMEFGKIVNRYQISDLVYSSDFWNYLQSNFSIKKENITVFCDIHSDVKHRIEKNFRYIVKVDKPFKIMFQFYDEEKVTDPKFYETEEEQRNKVTDILIYFDSDSMDMIDKIIDDIRKFTYLPAINKTFFIISQSSMGYELQAANIKDFDIQLDLNYGDPFVEKHNYIVNQIKNNKHGLFLFHGEPGTGKTTYIRKLVSELAEDKTIIYVPSYFMFDIANPELISFISKFRNSILLLEDAEMILTSSQEERSQAVSNILNISDGLLNDHMDMQIIATFNIEKKVLDEALMRKGRLMVDYRFKKLSAEQATKLSKHIGLNKEFKESKTLAEIYEDKIGKQLIDNDFTTKKLGFQFGNQN